MQLEPTFALSCLRRRPSVNETALNLASMAAIIRLRTAHVAVTIRKTKNQIVYSDMTRCVYINTCRFRITVVERSSRKRQEHTLQVKIEQVWSRNLFVLITVIIVTFRFPAKPSTKVISSSKLRPGTKQKV